MNRRQETLQWARLIPIAVVLAVVTACSSPDREAGKETPAPPPTETPTPTPTESVASNNPPPSNAAAPAPTPAPAPSAATTSGASTPAETPLRPDPEPAAQAPDTKTPAAEPAPDPLKWLQESEKRRVEYEKHLAELAADLENAKAFVARTERDLLAFRNPYLARPSLTESGAAEVRGLNGTERVQWAEKQVAAAIAAQASAQAAYDDAKNNPPVN